MFSDSIYYIPARYVRLSHSCILLKPLDEMRCHLGETLVWPKVTVLRVAPVPHRKGRFGGRNLQLEKAAQDVAQREVSVYAPIVVDAALLRGGKSRRGGH